MSSDDSSLPVSSSVHPEFAPEQRAMFVEVLTLLDARGVPSAVSGAFALHEHTGIWRDTKDLDLFMPHEHVPRAMELLAAAGLEIEISDPVWLCKARRGDYFVDLITGMSNCAVTVEQSWIDRARKADVLGFPARVLAAEELLVSKLFVTRRERFDAADILHVIYGTAGRLDWERVLALVGEHWMMLLWVMVLYQYVYPAHAEYLPRHLWDDLLGRLRTQLDHPDPCAAFRGSLIDDKMFAIDVNEWGLDDWNQRLRALRAPLRMLNDVA